MAKGEDKPGAAAADADDGALTLGVLSAIDADADISQRTLSNELGVALGLANAYLKRCVRKGYVKITAVPRRRYTYFLTPQGFAEKARLTGEYLTSSLQFFRRAREQMDEVIGRCAASGHRRIALAGASDIAEIATLTAHDHDVGIVGVIDAAADRETFCGLPVVRRLKDLGKVDAVIITGTDGMDRVVAELIAALGEERVYIPDLVQLSHIRTSRRKGRRNGAQGLDAAEPAE